MRTIALCLVTLCLFSSCATLMSGGGRNTVHIRTDPPAATISIINRKGIEVFNGKSQATIRLKTGAGYFVPARYTVKITAPGYEERSIEIKSTINGWYFANIFIGGLIGMVIVDPATGAMWRLREVALDEKLDKSNLTTGISLKVIDISTLSADQKKQLVEIR